MENRKIYKIGAVIIAILLFFGILFLIFSPLESDSEKPEDEVIGFGGLGEEDEQNERLTQNEVDQLPYINEEQAGELQEELANNNEANQMPGFTGIEYDDEGFPIGKPTTTVFPSPDEKWAFELVTDPRGDNNKLTILGTNIEIEFIANTKWSTDSQFIIFSKHEEVPGINGEEHSDLVNTSNLHVIRYDGTGEKLLWDDERVAVVDYVSDGNSIGFVTIDKVGRININSKEVETLETFEPYFPVPGINSVASISINDDGTFTVSLSENPNVGSDKNYSL